MNSLYLADLAGTQTELGLRWLHVVAGVLWLGILWFFNWINGAFAATMDGETKKKVVPELMPRALFWFRWGAAFTWLTGVSLLMALYYVGPYFAAAGTEYAGMKVPSGTWMQAFGAIIVGFVVYDVMFKALKGPLHSLGVLIWGGIAVVLAWYMQNNLEASNRAILIHVGGLFGTAMAANVWMRIWPAQKRIITAIKNGQAPDPADPAIAGMRSKHNTYMSISLLLFMVSVNQDVLLSVENILIALIVILAISFVFTWFIYNVMVPKVKGF